MPAVWTYTFKTMPWKALTLNYLGVVLVINAYNTAYSLMFEDYCKRSSSIYDVKKRNAHALRKLIKDTNDNEKKTVRGKANTSLSDDEIMNEK